MIRRLFAMSLIGASLCLATPSVADETVRITNGEWPPFAGERLPYGGVLSRIVAGAFRLEGVNVEYGYFPWKRSYEYAKSGKWDGSVGWALNPEHQRDFHMSAPVIIVDKALFHLKTTPFNWKAIDDLRSWRVGGTAGYSYGAEWDQAVRSGSLKVEEATTDDLSIRKLLMKRVDAVAMEVDVAEYLMRTLLTPEEAALLTHHPRLLAQTSIGLALSRQSEKSTGLLARFDRGLQRLKESGAYDAILDESRRGSHGGGAPSRR